MKRVVSIGYGRQLFEEGNVERKRMISYTKDIDSLHLIVFSLAKHGLKTQVVSDKLTFHPTNSKNKFAMIFDAITIGKKILNNSEKKDWILTTQDPFETAFVGYVLKRKYKIPLQIQEHGDVFSTAHWRMESIINQIRYIFGRWVLRRADCVRVVSERMVETMEKIGVPKEAIAILPVRTDVSVFNERERSSLLQEKFPEAQTIILTMARFVKQKNLSMLLEAFSQVYREHRESALVIVGTGPLENALKKQTEKLGLGSAVLFLPWAEDVAKLMHSADIYALSSNYGGWERVLIEAMASGLPTVTTDIGCVGEVFLHERHGLVVPVGNTDAFAAALKTLIEDVPLRLQYGENGRRDVLSVFDNEEVYASRWSEVFDVCKK